MVLKFVENSAWLGGGSKGMVQSGERNATHADAGKAELSVLEELVPRVRK